MSKSKTENQKIDNFARHIKLELFQWHSGASLGLKQEGCWPFRREREWSKECLDFYIFRTDFCSSFAINFSATSSRDIFIVSLTLIYMGSRIYVVTQGRGGRWTPLAKCFLRQPICMEMTKNGSQCKILVFSCPYVPKKVFFDEYSSCEKSQRELGYR